MAATSGCDAQPTYPLEDALRVQAAERQAATMKLLELDPITNPGAEVLLGVLDRMGRSDDK